MHATLPLLKTTDSAAIRRRDLDTLQVNVEAVLDFDSCFHRIVDGAQFLQSAPFTRSAAPTARREASA